MTEQARIIEMVVASLSEADVGDLVLRFSPEANRYEDGKYVGRGVWNTMAIVAANRQSLSLDSEMRQKFDRNTGAERAVKVGYPELIAGRKEFEAWRWDRCRYMIRDKLEKCRDVETLKAVAALVGFELPPVKLGNGR